jgi:hypothetical protein
MFVQDQELLFVHPLVNYPEPEEESATERAEWKMKMKQKIEELKEENY